MYGLLVLHSPFVVGKLAKLLCPFLASLDGCYFLFEPQVLQGLASANHYTLLTRICSYRYEMSDVVFVRADGLGRTKAEDRKLIRSRCMLGRNKKSSKTKIRRGEDRGAAKHHATEDCPGKDGATFELQKDFRVETHQTLLLPVSTWASSLPAFAREIDGLSRELLFRCKFRFLLLLSLPLLSDLYRSLKPLDQVQWIRK